MKQIKRKILSALIAMSLLITDSAVSVFADYNESEINTKLKETVSMADEETEPYPVEELTEYRTDNEKRFLMSDKSIKAVVYSEPVHFKNNEEYVDIDTTLQYENASEKSDVNGYISDNGDFQVKFAKKLNSGKLVTIKKDKYKLSWEYIHNSNINSTSDVKIKKKEKCNSIVEESVVNSSHTNSQIRKYFKRHRFEICFQRQRS